MAPPIPRSVSANDVADTVSGRVDGGSTLPSVPKDLASRQMCSAMHLHPPLAAQVLLDYSIDNPKAWCPPFGVDAVALVRHAQAAHTHWRKLYDAVALTRYSLLGLVTLAAFLLWRDGLATALLSLPLIAVACGVGWRTTFLSLQETRAAAIGIMAEEEALGAQAPEVESDLEDELAALHDANMIVFGVAAASPFVGSGTEIGRWALSPIDIGRGRGRGREENRDAARPPATFTIRELHDDLIRLARSRLGLSDIEVTKRIYVRGDVLPDCEGLFHPDEMRPPSRLETSWVDLGSDAPGEQARTYVCLAKSLVGGRIVVTLVARYTLDQGILSCEFAALVLPPVLRGSAPATGFYGLFGEDLSPLRGRSTTWALAIAAWRTYVAELFLRSERGIDLARAREERALHHYEALQEGRRYDYGSLFSARELAANASIESYFEVADVRDCLLRMQRGVIDCLIAFLTDKGIDTSEIAAGQRRIINNITNIGEVSGRGNIFGNHGRVSNVEHVDQSD
ncbi:hypothetical protein EV382_1940 [Micromonospora violae]|uniref:Uncharacterized protein n=1 Tax=Micromonospora violae TaxID=1278207 RepID=A0A4Q7UEN4_9ACTN|nr:hypothetical protein [Micromonospora violae]RZT78748.1 hypothetical protein EV382_1940 [Micromonospora violae]